MSNLRIALMPSAYAPAVGGVEVLTAQLAEQLMRRGHAVEVWAPRHSGDDLPLDEIIEGIRVRRFVFALPRAHPAALARTPFGACRTLTALRRAVNEFHPTHLNVHCFSGNGLYATILSRWRGLPLVVTLHGETVMDDRNIYDRSTTLRVALRRGLGRAAQVTGCSQFTLDDAARRFGLDPERSSVIFSGVDGQEVPPKRVDVPFGRYVLGLGRVVHKKGFDLLLRAFAQIAPAHHEVGLVIAGFGNALDSLRVQAADLGLVDRVHFTGSLNRGEVTAVMAGAEAFVMPSRVEPFGIVALEAWRAKVPVVVTSRGGTPEFVEDGRTGLIVDPYDTAELARSLDILLSDSELRFRLADAGQQRLERFSTEVLTTAYENVYAACGETSAQVPHGRSLAALLTRAGYER